MKFLNQRVAVALVAAGMAGMACAQTGQAGADPMAGSAGQGEAAAPAFNDLDKDQDGYISAVEATGDSTLMDKWTAVDANADRKIDQSEFSKFEEKVAQPGSEIPAAEGINQGMEGATEQGMQRPQQEIQQQQEGAESQY